VVLLLLVACILIPSIIWIFAVVVVVVAAAAAAAAAVRMDHIVYSHTPGDGKNGTNVVPVPHVCWFVRSLFYLASGADKIYNPSSSHRN
jgi:hypothetical protein